MSIQRVAPVCLGLALVLSAAAPAWAERGPFPRWLQGVRAEAEAKGISAQTVRAALPDTIRPIPQVIALDRRQPESTMTLSKYLRNIVSSQRISAGRSRYQAHHATLRHVGQSYGVDPEFVVALWGIETNFGKNTGGYSIVEALATLAYDGRRSSYFRAELMNALQIVDDGHISLPRMKGSWAGAMGQTQFMPTSFVRFAQDFNKDGKKDIWTSHSDIFASAANYLARSGWRAGEPWGVRVTLPKNFRRSLLGLEKKHDSKFWTAQGVRLSSGKALPAQGPADGSLIQPDGPGTPAYLVYNNYRVIMKWNKSTYFATAVGQLADAIRGGRAG